MSSPLLTIAIPTLNRASLLKRAVESALGQTRGGIEVLVSNNGSTDATRAYLDALADPRLRVVHHERTIPPMVHGKYVTEQVRTPYAVFLSDDDYLEPAFAARTLELYERHATLAFVHTRVRFIRPTSSFLSQSHPELQDGWRLLKEFLGGGHGPSHCATVYRAEDARMLTRALPEDVQLGDMFLWPTLAPRGQVGYVAEPLSNYTWNGGNMSVRIPIESWLRDNRLARERWEAEAVKSGLPPDVLRELQEAADRHFTRGALSHLWLRAIHGANKGQLARELLRHHTVLLAQPARAVTRAAAMLTLPASVLRLFRHLRTIGLA